MPQGAYDIGRSKPVAETPQRGECISYSSRTQRMHRNSRGNLFGQWSPSVEYSKVRFNLVVIDSAENGKDDPLRASGLHIRKHKEGPFWSFPFPHLGRPIH